MKTYPILILGVIVIIIVGLFAIVSDAVKTPAPGARACTDEARLCPDGSAVGRVGPNCEFAQCPTPKAATSTL